MKKKFYLVLTKLCILLNVFIFINCANDDNLPIATNTTTDYKEYLVIDNLAQRTRKGEKLQLSAQEESVLFKAFDRISDNSKNKQGKVDLSLLNASELNIEKHLFTRALDLLSPYIKGEKIIGEESVGSFPRVKSRAESGGGWIGGGGGGGGGGWIGGIGGGASGGGSGGGGTSGGGGSSDGSGLGPDEVLSWFLKKYTKDAVYYMICEQIELSAFERKCLSQYWYAKGDMLIPLLSDDWIGIKAATNCTNYQSGNIFIVEGMKFYKKTVSFYSSPEYDYALGSCTITFSDKGRPVGLRDRYDFNIFADRSLKAEAATIAMAVLGQYYGGKDYEIYYGVY